MDSGRRSNSCWICPRCRTDGSARISSASRTRRGPRRVRDAYRPGPPDSVPGSANDSCGRCPPEFPASSMSPVSSWRADTTTARPAPPDVSWPTRSTPPAAGSATPATWPAAMAAGCTPIPSRPANHVPSGTGRPHGLGAVSEITAARAAEAPVVLIPEGEHRGDRRRRAPLWPRTARLTGPDPEADLLAIALNKDGFARRSETTRLLRTM